MSEQAKLETLLESEGYELLEDFLSERGLDSCVPGICMNDDCDFTADYEPDQDGGWCDSCQTQSVKSGLMLAGLM